MKKKFFIGLFVFTTIAFFVFANVVLSKNVRNYQIQQNLSAPIDIPDASIVTIEQAEKIDKPIVALFYVDWCSYCRKFMPVFGTIAKEYANDYSFAAINCDNPKYLHMVKDFHIMGFPSVFIIDKKINHKFILNTPILTEKSLMKKELDNYISVRKNLQR